MLDTLPKDVWSNPMYRWLDPAVGTGAFPICIYYRLMEGLKDEIKNKDLRRKHILESMLYMCEIDDQNIKVLKIIFNSNNE